MGPAVPPAGAEPALAPASYGATGPTTAQSFQGALGHERRWVSVLFCDLVNYTSYAGGNDPEEVRDMLSRYFAVASAVIAHHGGTVEKFIGDAVMAVWGAQRTYEDDAARAVRAALELLEAVREYGSEAGVELAARVGVASGEAATTKTVQEGIVIGDRVNLAARVQTAAMAGTCYVDDTTHRLAGNAIAFEDAGSHELKGFAHPIQLFRATRALSRPRRQQSAGFLEAPLLGRDAELARLTDLYHAALEKATPSMVVVVGPAGVGKSRLGLEFERHLDALPDPVLWHRGHCLSYGEGVTFWALAEMVRQRLSIAEEDRPDVAAAKLAQGMGRLVPDEERGYVAARVARLLGTEGAEAREQTFAKEDLFAGWRQFFEHLAKRAPLVLVVEDAEHADTGLLEFLDHMVDWARLPIFVLVLARPGLAEDHPTFGVGRNRTTITLDPLDSLSIDRLVEALVPGIPPVARSGIAERSEGIALFALETVRSMIDAGIVVASDDGYRVVADLPLSTVPESLIGLLGARLDALNLGARRVVGVASVLGTRFSAEALVSVSHYEPEEVHMALDELVIRDVLKITTDPLSPQRGDYRFSHEMLRQVAYDRLARRERKFRHVEVAAHLRSSFANDAEEVADIVARHYLDALRALPRDPDARALSDEAFDFLIRAGQRAQRSGAPGRAAESYAEAARIAPDDEVADLFEKAAAAGDDAGDFDAAVTNTNAALDRYRHLGDARGVARVQALRGRILQRLGRHAAARVELVQALSVLRIDPGEDTVRALHNLARVEIYSGNLEDGARFAGEALELGRSLDVGSGELAQLFITNGLAAAYANETAIALANYETAALLAERAGDLGTLGTAKLDLGVVLRRTDPPRAVEAVRSSVEYAKRTGQREILAFAVANLALTLLQLGEWDEAERVLDEALEVEHLAHGFVYCFSGWLAALRGDAGRASRVLDPVPSWRASERVLVQASVWFLQALVAMCNGEVEKALSLALRVLEERHTLGIGADPPRWAWPLAARAAKALGDHETLAALKGMLEAQSPDHLPPLLRAELSMARALADGRGPTEGTTSSIEEALELFRAASNPYELAHALIDVAEAWILEGRDSGPLVREAESIAKRLRCAPLETRAAVVLTASAVDETR